MVPCFLWWWRGMLLLIFKSRHTRNPVNLVGLFLSSKCTRSGTHTQTHTHTHYTHTPLCVFVVNMSLCVHGAFVSVCWKQNLAVHINAPTDESGKEQDWPQGLTSCKVVWKTLLQADTSTVENIFPHVQKHVYWFSVSFKRSRKAPPSLWSSGVCTSFFSFHDVKSERRKMFPAEKGLYLYPWVLTGKGI